MSKRNQSNDEFPSCVIILMLFIFAMPLVGLYLAITGKGESKGLGVVLLVVGLIIWIAIGCHS